MASRRRAKKPRKPYRKGPPIRRSPSNQTRGLFSLRTAPVRRVADVVKTILEEHEARSHTKIDPSFNPNDADLAVMLEAAMWATMEPDEGRYPRFSLVFTPPTEGSLKIEERPVTARAISKLAPALHPSLSRIGLHRSATTGGLAIWGLLPGYTSCLEVRGVEPGSIIVRLRPWNLAVFRRNEYHDLVHRDPTWGIHGLGREQVLGPLSNAFATSQSPERRAVTAVLLLMIADAIRAQGNGGTLLVVPTEPTHRTVADAWLALGPNRPSITLEAIFDKYVPILKGAGGDPLEAVQKTSLGEYMRGRPDKTDSDVLSATAVLGRLSAVDGAVVVTDELELLAFGGTIRPPSGGPTKERIFCRSYLDYADPRRPGEEVDIGRLGGTRRQSAARFVANAYDTVAITVSHDGPTTLALWFAKDEDTGGPRAHLMTHFETILD